MRKKSLKIKIIISTALCIMAVGIFSSMYLYSYLTGIIAEKANQIHTVYLDTTQKRIDNSIDDLLTLAYNA
ncbi:MAG: hypothetical protein ACK5L3_04615, partial [Oscillospiraceae bacterium]